MTISEKIIAAHADQDALSAEDYVLADVDLCLANDITAPIAIDVFHEIVGESGRGVFDRDKIALIPDHFTPNKDIKSAIQCQRMRSFARDQALTHYYEVGRCGIEHCFLPEQGLVGPGDLVIGADSHTCTYGALGAFSTGVGSTDLGAAMALGKAWLKVPETIQFVFKGELQPWVSGKDLILYAIGQVGVDGANYAAMEFTGPVIRGLSMAARFTMSNMAIEAGAKAGLIAPDDITRAYVADRVHHPIRFYENDSDATFKDRIEYECSGIELQVALPHLPENAKPVREVEEMDVEIDQAVIGSCTNGRLEDLRVAARVMKGHQVPSSVRCIILPGTQQIYLAAAREGLVEQFIQAGAIVSTPTCGPCLGGHMGILGEDEVAISTTNRNFIGRMGHPTSKIYLAGPAVAAASALKGKITSPAGLD